MAHLAQSTIFQILKVRVITSWWYLNVVKSGRDPESQFLTRVSIICKELAQFLASRFLKSVKEPASNLALGF